MDCGSVRQSDDETNHKGSDRKSHSNWPTALEGWFSAEDFHRRTYAYGLRICSFIFSYHVCSKGLIAEMRLSIPSSEAHMIVKRRAEGWNSLASIRETSTSLAASSCVGASAFALPTWSSEIIFSVMLLSRLDDDTAAMVRDEADSDVSRTQQCLWSGAKRA